MTADPTEALLTYAAFIESFVGDADRCQRPVWVQEITRALRDAHAVKN